MYLKKTFAGILLPSLLLLTAAVVFPAAAQDKPEARRTYSGTVRDEDGTPLFGAAVLIGSTREGVTTDLDGRCRI